MIIIGYQGIGKSTVARFRANTIDLESSCFKINGNRADDWYIPYCQIALHLSDQGNVVFTSSHKEVRDYLSVKRIDNIIAVCYPILDLEDEWVGKLNTRWMQTKDIKDFVAFANARKCYAENIKDLMASPFIQMPIDNMDYNLNDMIERIEDDTAINFRFEE